MEQFIFATCSGRETREWGLDLVYLSLGEDLVWGMKIPPVLWPDHCLLKAWVRATLILWKGERVS